jgi:hypothetical protein
MPLPDNSVFPESPSGLRGRDAELATLSAILDHERPSRVALVGSGGSGKSMLAAALAHRVASRFPGGLHWFRVGAWDFRTLTEMLALRFRTTRDRHARVAALERYLTRGGARLIVLDNHEDDEATARLLDALGTTRATFLITARRCLLSGVLIYPLTAPLVTVGKSAFPRVASLTQTLRFSPLALDIANAIVASGAATPSRLRTFLEKEGIDAVRVIDHEDDLPEVGLLVAWAWKRLDAKSREMLGVLAHAFGDHVDLASLAHLAGSPKRALRPLLEWHLVQEPLPRRYALHAVVRHAVRRWTEPNPRAVFEHYIELLERHPERLDAEQTHLFAAMDHAHRTSDLDAMLRVERLLTLLS